MASKAPNLRRLLASLTLAAAVALGTLAAVGFASPADASDGSGFPAVPAPVAGDRGTYTPDPEPTMGGTELRFEWLEPAGLLDGEGRPHETFPLMLETDVQFDDREFTFVLHVHYDRATGEPVGSTSTGQAEGEVGDAGATPLGGSQQTHSSWYETLWFGQEFLPCGLGLNRLGADVELSGCREETFTVVAVGESEGHRLWTLEGNASGVRVTFRNDVPVPTLIESEESRLVLTGFEPGEGSSARAEIPDPVKLPPARFAAGDELGPDASGVEVHYPLAQAIGDARADPESGLDAFLARSETWMVVDAAAFDEQREDERLYGWSFRIQSEDGSFWSTYGHREVVMVGPAAGLPPVSGLLTRDTPIRFEHEDGRGVLPQGELTWPTVASVRDRWLAYEGTQVDGPILYSFEVRCPDEACAEPEVAVEAGLVSFVGVAIGDGFPLLPQESSTAEEATSLAVDGSGGTVSHTLARSEYERTLSGQSGIVESGRSSGHGSQETATPFSIAGASWTVPGGKVATGATLAGLLAALALWAWPVLKGGGAAALFSRTQEDTVLRHPLRATIMDLVRSRPGIHYQEIVRQAGAGRGTVEHHLRKLAQARLVVARPSQGYTCYFPAQGTTPAQLAGAGALKSDGARRVLKAIATHPGASGLEVARETGLDPGTVHHHVRRLGEAGLVTSRRDGRMVRLQPTAGATEALGAA